MQEEVTGKAVALIIDGAKISEQTLEKAIKQFWRCRRTSSRRSTGASKPSNSLRARTQGWQISR